MSLQPNYFKTGEQARRCAYIISNNKQTNAKWSFTVNYSSFLCLCKYIVVG